MTDHTENSLRAVASSLRTIVGPAVDTADPLAQQQLQLVIAYIDFLRSRLPHLADRDRFEVLHNVRLAESALDSVGTKARTGLLADAVEQGRQIASTAGASRDQLRRVAALIAARVHTLIESDLDDRTRRTLERAVTTSSAERVEFDRAWYGPMGFDPEPDSARPLTDLLPRSAFD